MATKKKTRKKTRPAAKKKTVKKKASAPKKTASKKRTAAQKKTASRKRTAAQKKTASKKRATPSRKKTKKTTAFARFKKKLTAWFITTGVILVSIAVAYVLLHPKAPLKKPVAVKPGTVNKAPRFDKPTFEIFPTEPIPPPRKATLQHRQAVQTGRPMVAIIIDDIGYDKPLAQKFMDLDAAITCSVLPFAPYHTEIAALAEKKGRELMLHLPMEPNEYPGVDPGPGALLASMTPDERIDRLKRDLDAMPHIKGVNNHMGSKMTTLSDQINQVFSVLKKRGLFFIDSRTTAASQCRSSARLFKLPFAQRDVFIDNVQTKASIHKQIEQLINIAQIHGEAVGIGHPHCITYEVLAEELPQIKEQVRLVRASDIVAVPQ